MLLPKTLSPPSLSTEASPTPKGEHFTGGTQAIRMNAPLVYGSFAVWGGLFSTFYCTMVYVCQNEDPWNWNSVIAGTATGGFLQMRQGLGPATRSAEFGGVLLTLIEGVGIMLNKFLSAQKPMSVLIEDKPQNTSGYQLPNRDTVPDSILSSLSWFGGLFGGKQEELKPKAKTRVLESFDSPLPPTFEFK